MIDIGGFFRRASMVTELVVDACARGLTLQIEGGVGRGKQEVDFRLKYGYVGYRLPAGSGRVSNEVGPAYCESHRVERENSGIISEEGVSRGEKSLSGLLPR